MDATRSYRVMVAKAKTDGKPLELWPGDAARLDISDLPSVPMSAHPRMIQVKHLYLDYRNGGFHLDDIRHLLRAGYFYAITRSGIEWIRVTEYVTEEQYKRFYRGELS
jgi:hypothetical protein